MAAAGLPNASPDGLHPLTDGAILIGAQHLSESSTPPRVVFVPMGSAFGPRSVASRGSVSASSASPQGAGVLYVAVANGGTGAAAPAVTFSAPELLGGVTATGAVVSTGGGVQAVRLTNAGSGYLNPPTVTLSGVTGATAYAFLGHTQEHRAELQQRAIWTDKKLFTVWCWNTTYVGSAPAPSADGDWDAAELLYQLVIQSIHAVMPGAYGLGRGKWIDSTTSAAKLIAIGRLYTFELEIGTPVPDRALAFAPTGTFGSYTLKFNDPSGGVVPGDEIAGTG
jgi:hypothetical protein